jgi:hypothetical protein
MDMINSFGRLDDEDREDYDRALSGIPGEVGGAVVTTAAGVVIIALAGVAAVGGIVGAGVAAAMAKPGQKPAYAKGAIIGAASLFGIGIVSSLVKG